MHTDSAKSTHQYSHKPLVRIGIECESIEDDSYGVARLTSKLLEQLAARPELEKTHRFILYFSRRVPDLACLKSPVFQTRLIGLPRWRLPASFSVYYYLLLPLELWRHPVDVMYYPNYMLPLAHPPRTPSLVMMTEDIYREARNPKLPFRYRAAYLVFSLFWAARRATRVMAISESSRDTLMRFGIPRERIAVNELAVDAPRIRNWQSATRHSFLWVGQAFERRHLREALAAFTELARERPELTFRVIGPDKYNPPLIEETVRLINRRLDRPAVTWEPYVTDEALAEAYASSHAVVYVSDAEAFGLPPLEGLSYGAVPVVADKPVCREVYGEHAFYSAEPSVAGIGAAMQEALTDERRRAGILRTAPAITARYSWQAHAQRFLRIMSHLAT